MAYIDVRIVFEEINELIDEDDPEEGYYKYYRPTSVDRIDTDLSEDSLEVIREDSFQIDDYTKDLTYGLLVALGRPTQIH